MLNGELCHFIGNEPVCNEHFNNYMEPLEDEPDAEDVAFAERAEDDKQQGFDDSRGVGQ